MSQKLQSKYPKAYELFTPTEWKLFTALTTRKHAVHVTELAQTLSLQTHSSSNTVAVHIKNMRLKMHKHGLPFEIKSRWGHGTYLFIQH
jgi:DNA-binding response OmpR family regulator